MSFIQDNSYASGIGPTTTDETPLRVTTITTTRRTIVEEIINAMSSELSRRGCEITNGTKEEIKTLLLNKGRMLF